MVGTSLSNVGVVSIPGLRDRIPHASRPKGQSMNGKNRNVTNPMKTSKMIPIKKILKKNTQQFKN